MLEPDDRGRRNDAATLTATRSRDGDVTLARRGAATFGGGEPTLADAFRRYVRRYGWRAYALPVLVVVTVVALFTTTTNPPGTDTRTNRLTGRSTPAAAPPPAVPSSALKSDQPTGDSVRRALQHGQLPPGPAYTRTGNGTFRRVPGKSGVVGRSSDGRVWRYDIEVENGITGIDVARYASTVQAVLSQSRSWAGHGAAIQRVDRGPIDFHVSLTSAMTVRQYCGWDIKLESSCYGPVGSAPGLDVNRVVLNDARWVRGSAPYAGDLSAYRIYMINHEFGHALGHRHAHQCLPGGLAPVMMQQTFGLTSAATGAKCGANPWPYPPGVNGAPGAEQADTAQNDELNLD